MKISATFFNLLASLCGFIFAIPTVAHADDPIVPYRELIQKSPELGAVIKQVNKNLAFDKSSVQKTIQKEIQGSKFDSSTGTRGGGDWIEAEFKTIALGKLTREVYALTQYRILDCLMLDWLKEGRLSETWREDDSHLRTNAAFKFSNLFFYSVLQMRVITKSSVNVDGIPRSAAADPKTLDVEIASSDWEAVRGIPTERDRLIFHEVFRLIGVSDTDSVTGGQDYKSSQSILAAYEKRRNPKTPHGCGTPTPGKTFPDLYPEDLGVDTDFEDIWVNASIAIARTLKDFEVRAGKVVTEFDKSSANISILQLIFALQSELFFQPTAAREIPAEIRDVLLGRTLLSEVSEAQRRKALLFLAAAFDISVQ